MEWLRKAHAEVRAVVRPVYALNDMQPVSTTLRRGRGACSQRLAVLEALARRQPLFDVIGRNGVVWGGGCGDGVCDLSMHTVEGFGYFDDRDSLFKARGQTLCSLARTLGEPVMSRRNSKAGRR